MRPNADLCPSHFVEEINRYVKHGLEPGSFMLAVLSNDLMKAFNRGDEEAIENMPHIVCFIYNRIPSNVWGSPAKVAAFLAARREELSKE